MKNPLLAEIRLPGTPRSGELQARDAIASGKPVRRTAANLATQSRLAFRGNDDYDDTERYREIVRKRDKDLRDQGLHDQADAELARINRKEQQDAKDRREQERLRRELGQD